ncbi:MAG: hypothetical protein AMJ53_17830 [Gammaproteobacteria bacterium SG8_11]|nr:MAG: hypothetical protein AMJ53_17830 [Gammaproteobacteria bacterium SG8_11]
MARKIVQLEELNDDQSGTTVSTGLVHGGTVMNVFPEYCRAEVDIRFSRLMSFFVKTYRFRSNPR